MANGHLENHGPISNHSTRLDIPESNQEPSPEPESMKDTTEYRVMRAYATRRHPKKKPLWHDLDKPGSENGNSKANGSADPQTLVQNGRDEVKEEKKKKKKKKGFRLGALFRCLKPQTKEDEEPAEQPPASPHEPKLERCGSVSPDAEEEDDVIESDTDEDLGKLVTRLIGISDDIQFVSDIESDGGEDQDNVEKITGLLLRESGDRLNERMVEEGITPGLLLNYAFFKALMTTFLKKIGFRSSSPNALGPQASYEAQIAVTCEITSRLLGVDSLPWSPLLLFGATYLQEFYSSWVQDHGGYEAAIQSDDDEVD